MKITVSFLKSKYDTKKTLEMIESTDADYIHVDIMDGRFVPKVQLPLEECLDTLSNTTKKLDIHLMVEEPLEYIETLSSLNVSYFTVHIELGNIVSDLIDRIHALGIRAGLAINPDTDIESLNPYLDRIDYIIVMGVTPGAGGQPLIPSTVDKVNELNILRENNCYHYSICLDGGVNIDTRSLLDKADVLVSGSFICMSDDYQDSIDKLR